MYSPISIDKGAHARSMGWVRRSGLLGLATAAVLAIGAAPPAVLAAAPGSGTADTGVTYNILAAEGVAAERVAAAARAAGAEVERVNAAVGLLTVRAGRDGFADAMRGLADVAALAPVRVIGRSPDVLATLRDVSRLPLSARPLSTSGDPAAKGRPAGPAVDPLDGRLWGLTAIRAEKAHKVTKGDRRVLVGVIDTGIDGRHPDLAPVFDRKRSRNFTKDIAEDATGRDFDGPCEVAGCVDPADVDDGGHGTHVAGTIAAAVNGRGISGVAPGVRLVNLRGGQDSGYFLLQPVVDALTYAGDIGVDVVNMSFYLDPWVFNCPDNALDTPAQQAEQKVALGAIERAMAYAHGKGVTQLGSYGNDGQDNDRDPQLDLDSPNIGSFGPKHPRLIDRAKCRTLPQDMPQSLNIGAAGPSGAKSGYSTFGMTMSVSAPGGWTEDLAGTPEGGATENKVLSTWPEGVARAEKMIDSAGAVTDLGKRAGLLRECAQGSCAYYYYAEGTSMATPHASGVAALIVSRFGRPGLFGPGLGMRPADVRRVLEATATDRACGDPTTELLTYGAVCKGDAAYNSFYGHGTIDAYAAVTASMTP
jgi:subtilisin family serine protease